MVGESNRTLQGKGVEVPVYYLFHEEFPDVEFFATRCYIYVAEEGPYECIFDHTEVQAYKRDVMQP